MNEKTHPKVDKDIKSEYELLKLQAETNKINAETKVIKDKNKFFTKYAFYLKPLFAGILAVPLCWFYFQEIFLPTMQRENIELALKNAKGQQKLIKATESLDLQKAEHHREVEQLRREQNEVQSKLSALENIKERLSEENKGLQDDFDKLSEEMKNSEVVTKDMELKVGQLTLKLERNNKLLSMLKEFYDAYWRIKERTYLFIDPKFKYEGKSELSQLQTELVEQIPVLFKTAFKVDFSNTITMLNRETEYLLEDEILNELTEEEKKAFYYEANYKVTGAILDFHGNQVLTRFELLKIKDGKKIALISFLYNLLIDSQNPVEVFESYNLARDRILKNIYLNKLAQY